MRRKSAPRSVSNRPLGERALITRERLLEATAKLLASGGVLDFKVSDVARVVETSPATFYQYFRSVEDAILELSAKVAKELHLLLPLLDEPWTGTRSLDKARLFVDRYFDFFDANRAVLSYRNLAAQEGDQRFRKIRNDANFPLTTALQAKVDEAKKAGRLAKEISSFAAAAGMIAMMERLAAFRYEMEARGVDRDALVETTARIVHQTVTGRR